MLIVPDRVTEYIVQSEAQNKVYKGSISKMRMQFK